jgi:dTDP-3-amino-2,3,6-trideoxy-4-keto-D-glucose/dTDP-3-amino-3,4,6-trideoxy-alpha-D-glucose/dTDP-2,6-dideoxy-D-kanosamine transaminase
MSAEPIPLNDLKRHTQALSGELRAAVDRVMARGWFVLGPEVEAFEHEFAAYCGANQCVAVANGTDALELALRAVGVGPGDRVATVANAGGYGSTAIRAVGGLPQYVEIAADSMTMSPEALSAGLTPNVRAIIVTHLYGQMADMPNLLLAAGRLGIPVIEDCAQAHGAELDGRRAGNWGTIGCYSFYPTKNLGALGDAGAIVTNDAALAQSVRLFRQYGWRSKYHSSVAGGRNSRLDEIQAALLRAKLPHLDKWNSRRRAIAAAYNQGLSAVGLRLPCSLGPDYVAHLYVVRADRRDELRASLRAGGVASDVHYPLPDYLQASCNDLGLSQGYLPVSEAACQQVLTLPCFPELRHDEIDIVVAAVSVSLHAAPAGTNRAHA